jgi:heme/copper-type cytochrome/quinol oxidase subunit 1
MPFARRFGALILGTALIAAGVVLDVVGTPQASFGWTAYAPLTSTTFVPMPSPNVVEYALALIAIGLVLVAGWVGFQLGFRRRGAR